MTIGILPSLGPLPHSTLVSPQMKKSMFDHSVKLDESLTSVQQKIEYLGVNIGDKLNFKKHIKIVEQKVAFAVSDGR